jgi:hypothetical protein
MRWVRATEHSIVLRPLESLARRAYHPGVFVRGGPEGIETRMGENSQARLLQLGGWLLVVIGMVLPTIFIVAAPRWLILILPLACVILAFGLILVSGRWPSGKDAA